MIKLKNFQHLTTYRFHCHLEISCISPCLAINISNVGYTEIRPRLWYDDAISSGTGTEIMAVISRPRTLAVSTFSRISEEKQLSSILVIRWCTRRIAGRGRGLHHIYCSWFTGTRDSVIYKAGADDIIIDHGTGFHQSTIPIDNLNFSRVNELAFIPGGEVIDFEEGPGLSALQY